MNKQKFLAALAAADTAAKAVINLFDVPLHIETETLLAIDAGRAVIVHRRSDRWSGASCATVVPARNAGWQKFLNPAQRRVLRRAVRLAALRNRLILAGMLQWSNTQGWV